MVLPLSQLKSYLESEGVRTKYIKRGILYCAGDRKYAKFKVTVKNPESTDKPYKALKEETGQNIYGDDFETKQELAEYLLDKQSNA